MAKVKFPRTKIQKPGAKDTHPGINGQPHRGDFEYCKACNFFGSISICTCGHRGDRTPSQHAGYNGHGPCMMPGCTCRQFTWSEFVPEYAAALDAAAVRKAVARG